MKKLVLLFATFTLIAAALTASTTADGTVSATINPEAVAVTVSPDTVDYGVLSTDAQRRVPTPAFFTASNAGNVAAKFEILGSDTEDWELGPLRGDDIYVHRFDTQSDPHQGTVRTLSSTTEQVLADGVQVIDGDIDVYLNLDMPDSTMATEMQTAMVTIIVSKATP